MSPEDQAQYEEALQKARDTGIRVLGTGEEVWGDRHFRAWYVSTSADPEGTTGGYHTVRLSAEGRTLSCNCEAGVHGKRCYHRALVRDALLAEEQTLKRAEERQRDRATQRWTTGVRTYPYDGRKKNSACGSCGVPFELQEPLVLADGKAYHPECLPAGPTPAAGEDAPRYDAPANLDWQR